jgi:hypothetical protein
VETKQQEPVSRGKDSALCHSYHARSEKSLRRRINGGTEPERRILGGRVDIEGKVSTDLGEQPRPIAAQVIFQLSRDIQNFQGRLTIRANNPFRLGKSLPCAVRPLPEKQES